MGRLRSKYRAVEEDLQSLYVLLKSRPFFTQFIFGSEEGLRDFEADLQQMGQERNAVTQSYLQYHNQIQFYKQQSAEIHKPRSLLHRLFSFMSER